MILIKILLKPKVKLNSWKIHEIKESHSKTIQFKVGEYEEKDSNKIIKVLINKVLVKVHEYFIRKRHEVTLKHLQVKHKTS